MNSIKLFLILGAVTVFIISATLAQQNRVYYENAGRTCIFRFGRHFNNSKGDRCTCVGLLYSSLARCTEISIDPTTSTKTTSGSDTTTIFTTTTTTTATTATTPTADTTATTATTTDTTATTDATATTATTTATVPTTPVS